MLATQRFESKKALRKKEQNESRNSKFKNLGTLKVKISVSELTVHPPPLKVDERGGRATLPKRKVKFRHTLSLVHAHTN